MHGVGFCDGRGAEGEAAEERPHDRETGTENADADFDEGPCCHAALGP